MASHEYDVKVTWTGDLGRGTADYRAYARDHEVAAPGKPTLAGSSDPRFRGDPQRWNPEELLVASLSQCHLLWYLEVRHEPSVAVAAEASAAAHR